MVEHQPSKLDTWVRFPSPAFCVRSTQVCAADTGKAGKRGIAPCFLYAQKA